MAWSSKTRQLALRGGLCLLVLLGGPGAALAADSAAARVLRVTGRVSVQRGADLWAVHASDFIQPGEVILSGPDGYALVQLEDGSQFEVFADSRVVFRANRGNWRDLLDIFLGKVKFQIQKLGGRPHPYRVNSVTALIAVRGTVFEVSVERDETTIIAVEEGLVAVAHRLLPGGREVLLRTGEALVVRPSEPLTAAGVGKARLVGRILTVALDGVLRTGRLGGGGRRPIPGRVPGAGGTSPGDSGQAPPPRDVPDGDSGPGAGPPTGPSSSPPAPPPPSSQPKPGRGN